MYETFSKYPKGNKFSFVSKLLHIATSNQGQEIKKIGAEAQNLGKFC